MTDGHIIILLFICNLQKQLSPALFSDWLMNASLQSALLYLHKGEPINTKRFRKRLQRRTLAPRNSFHLCATAFQAKNDA